MPFVVLLILFVIGACWGSFLNVLAFRLVQGTSFLNSRSACPSCLHTIAWHDLIPLFSWCILKGKCRICSSGISILYPLIELFTAITLTVLALYVPAPYFVAYFIFFSALIVTIRTDLEYMLISRFMTLYLVPLGFILSIVNRLPISLYASLVGALGGYICLYIVGFVFNRITHKEGMGQGDLDLLAFIGAFTGPMGCWTSLLIGSMLGSGIGITYLLVYKPAHPLKIPFGPFLAIGAMVYIFTTVMDGNTSFPYLYPFPYLFP